MMAPISSEVIAKLRALRQLRHMSAQPLTDEVAARGFPVTRSSVAAWETGRKNTIPVDFLLLAAEVLGTTAVAVLTAPVTCPARKGKPPEGFTCNTCGAVGGGK
jgi:transcriptional regulator with XRE-family HTH domain